MKTKEELLTLIEKYDSIIKDCYDNLNYCHYEISDSELLHKDIKYFTCKYNKLSQHDKDIIELWMNTHKQLINAHYKNHHYKQLVGKYDNILFVKGHLYVKRKVYSPRINKKIFNKFY